MVDGRLKNGRTEKIERSSTEEIQKIACLLSQISHLILS